MTNLKWISAGILLASMAQAKIDLVTLPEREKVQITIYNSADLTLVREQRSLTLSKGLNKLQFSWANTLIDPTSLSMTPREHADQIDIFDLTFPPRVRELGLWNIKSDFAGKAPVDIDYLTSGLSWRAFFMGTLNENETAMRLQGYVRVSNNSGEDYEHAQTRLIVGKVNLLDQIAELAKRKEPYGRPGATIMLGGAIGGGSGVRMTVNAGAIVTATALPAASKPKAVAKEGLSEYFLYTIEGEETIPHGWSKRLPSFEVGEVPVINLYKYEEERYSRSVVRFLNFKNDKEHKLGETPIPGGMLKLYRQVDPAQHLSHEGQSSFKYIPVAEDVELNLGAVGNVVVTPTLMDYKTDQFMFDGNNNINGWVEHRSFKVEVNNTRPVPVKVEVTRNFPSPYWDLEHEGEFGTFEKVDLDTVKFTLELPPASKRTFHYTHHTRLGNRASE